jgi:hypothetical protein
MNERLFNWFVEADDSYQGLGIRGGTRRSNRSSSLGKTRKFVCVAYCALFVTMSLLAQTSSAALNLFDPKNGEVL